ncbi:transcription repressor NadR [Natranaerofaba carboxydovora]|uniref:transcription repressor NadR n=1 Tax=Natranaerofaba carboxydovora TaxID=2742683 RepID=UPI001F1357FF|nr:transcription repressor NadR [Natranaerofaba carboxydovora]UMZ74842.1 putative transcription repressor NiaR [Natranaerofaba carboxydovora]
MTESKAQNRREKILEHLSGKTPITGSKLGDMLGVSRQVIVQDIAILRAGGHEIISTPQGYLLKSDEEKTKELKFTIASKHDREGIRDELTTIVDLGGKVIDVIVEHPIYGEISGYLMIGSRRDVEEFLSNLSKSKAEPLSYLTGGVHLHTIEVSKEEIAEEIKNALKNKGFLIE